MSFRVTKSPHLRNKGGQISSYSYFWASKSAQPTCRTQQVFEQFSTTLNRFILSSVELHATSPSTNVSQRSHSQKSMQKRFARQIKYTALFPVRTFNSTQWGPSLTKSSHSRTRKRFFTPRKFTAHLNHVSSFSHKFGLEGLEDRAVLDRAR